MRILIAGGGTGGHIFPAVALAEQFLTVDSRNEVLFVGTENPLEMTVLANKGFRHVALSVAGLKGRGPWRQCCALAKIPGAVIKAGKTIRRFRPHIIIGVGGYASGPVALAAKWFGIPVVIHEQNCIPGMTNRMVARFACRIFVSFPNDDSVFPDHKVVLTGNPVRRDVILARNAVSKEAHFTVLIVGGSQGARAINKAVTEALPYLDRSKKIAFIHQTGEHDIPWVKKAYERQAVESTVQSFFTDMAGVYKKADLVICRAGATTVAELTALGKPALYIPFPFAANNHQECNARYVTDAGGGQIILEKDLDGKRLAEQIETFADNPKRLEEMSRRALSLGRPHAADRIVAECGELVSAKADRQS